MSELKLTEDARSRLMFGAWLASEEGQKCKAGEPRGIYLRNRLERAYQQGWADGRTDERVERAKAN